MDLEFKKKQSVLTKYHIDPDTKKPITVPVVEKQQVHPLKNLIQMVGEVKKNKKIQIIDRDMIPVNKPEKITQPYHYYVDYEQNLIHFHPDIAGQTVEYKYEDMGVTVISANKIFTKQDEKGNVIELLEDIIRLGREAIDVMETIGGVAIVMKRLEDDIKEGYEVSDKIQADIQQAKDEILSVRGNKEVIIKSSDWTLNVDVYEKEITHDLNSENLHVTARNSDTKEAVTIGYKILDKTRILLKSDEAINMSVILSASYYHATQTISDDIAEEVVKARKGEVDLKTKIDSIDEQLDNNVHIINSIAYVDVTRFAGVDDSEKLRNAFSYIINLDDNYTKKLTTSKILEINESVVLDFGWKKGYELDLQITPNGGIGNAITITKAIGLKGKLDVIGGGNDTNSDVAYLVNHLHHCKLEIFGSYYKGTIFSANGKEADYSRCIGMEIKLRNYNCNRSFFIGDETYPSAGFGTITELWEETWDSSKAIGSEVIGVSDISFPHYESHFITNEENQTNLFLNGCKSVYFGYLALGGKCKQLFKLGYNCDVTIDSLHLGSEDGNSVNGVYIGQESDLFVRFCKGIAVGTLVECKNAGSVYFDILRPNPEVDKVVIYNGQDLGYGKKIMSFSNVEKANYKQNNIYQVYKENFATAPSSVADTDRTLNTLKRCNELYASLSNTKDDVIYNSSNAIACQINEGAVIGSFGELRFDTTCSASETIVCNLDFKVTNFAEGGMVKIAIEYYDSGWNLIATGYERVMDRNNYLSFQQFNFEPFSLIADNPPSNVAYARFTIKIKRATSNTTRLCLSAFSVRKKLIL